MTNAQTKKTCGCQTNGLAILPVRYTVIPTYLERPKPQWANLPSVTSIPLASGYQYHVRSLREGYLYLYLPAEMGDNKWQIYSIDDEGHLFKQKSNATVQSASEIKEISGDYHCPELKENSTHNSFITIENPAYQQKVYIAYSEFPWTDEVLKRHEQAPEKRMQVVEPSHWKNGQSSNQSATIATQHDIENVLDFDAAFDKKLLPYDEQHLIEINTTLNNKKAAKVPKFNYIEALSYDKNGENGNKGDKGKPYGFKENILNKNTTGHPWTKQQGQSQHLANTMAKYSSEYSPILLAIDDSLGIVHELNGYYTETFAKNEQYRQEREFEFDAKQSYEYAMQILIQKEFTNDLNTPFTEHPYLKKVLDKKTIERSAELPVFSSYNQISVLIYEQYYRRINTADYVRIIRVDNNFNSGLTYADFTKTLYDFDKIQFLHNSSDSYSDADWMAYHKAASFYQDSNPITKIRTQINSIDSIEKKVEHYLSYYNANEKKFEEQRKEKINSLRAKYAAHLKTEAFDAQYELLITTISKIAEVRVKQVINWIKQSNFYQHIQDLNGNQWLEVIGLDEQAKEELDNQLEIDQALSDNEITETEAKELQKINVYGILYSSVVERSIAGLELTETGKDQINKWFADDNVNQDTSDGLMWRGVANNSDSILTEIQQLLASAKTLDDKAVVDEVYSSTKVGKLASYYKKTQGFLNAVADYKNEIASLTKLNIEIPKENRLLKLALSKPLLGVNNLILRLSNIICSPLAIAKWASNASFSYLFNFSFYGVPKVNTIVFLKAQVEMNRHILTSPLQRKINLPGGVVAELTSTEYQKVMERNAKYIRIKDKYYKSINKILNNSFKDRMSNTKVEVDTTYKKAKDITPNKSSGNKVLYLSLVIGICEAYNWWQLTQKQQQLETDEFWTSEIMLSTMAVTAATAEIIAQYTKIKMGSMSIAAGRTKVLSGIAGAAVGVYMSVEKGKLVVKEFSRGNNGLAILNLVNTFAYSGSAMTGVLSSITYHIPWCERIIGYLSTRTLRTALSRAAVSAMLKILVSRVILLALNFWFGIAILLIEGLIWWLSNDDLEDWLEYSALGTKNNNSNAYQHIYQQQAAFRAVLESMFGIDEQVLQINQQNQIEYKTTATVKQTDESVDNQFNEYDALRLISQDLAKQKASRMNQLTTAMDIKKIADQNAIDEKKAAEKYAEEAKYSNIKGYSIPDIFSGNWH